MPYQFTCDWEDPKRKIQKVYTLTEQEIKELEYKKSLLKPKMEGALQVFKMIYSDLYNE